MLQLFRRLLVVAAVVFAVSAPSAAFAFLPDASGGSSTSGRAQRSVVPSVAPAAASVSQGFQWGDAGIGAGGVLAVVGVGAGAAVVIRRRVHHSLAS
jgi:hypothetical protein